MKKKRNLKLYMMILAKGYNQTDFANKLGTSYHNVHNWLLGRKPNESHLKLFCKVFSQQEIGELLAEFDK